MKTEITRGIKVMLLCFSAACLAACGGASKGADSSSDMAAEAVAYEEAAGIALNNGAAETGMESIPVEEVADAARKLIRTVDLNVETESYDQLMADLETRVGQLGGYIEFKEAYYGNQYSSGSRSASLQIRIPAKRLDEFTDKVKEAANVTRENESIEDVTLTYVDLESHKKMLIAQQERLLELLEQVQTIEDIITLEGRLSEVRYQIESMETQLRTYDNLVEYGTVNLYIQEVERYTSQPEKGAWDRIRTGFSQNLYLVGNGIKNFAIEFVIALPILAVWAVVILLLLLVLRLILKWEKKKNEERAAKRREREGRPPTSPISRNNQSKSEEAEQNS
ncbi:MAG: DUF4349 domain-containing protein [Lachnospiraceae bacterium]|nr:DUF4349 domain-containing protein [Lachnospiraceae bacterium]MDY3223341.1 DUF4349 domain-containing protein [Lachnospiraceae bacterium]